MMEERRERVLMRAQAPPRTEVGDTPEVVVEVQWRNASDEVLV